MRPRGGSRSPPTAPATGSPSTSTPDPGGTLGQVVTFGADESVRYVVAPSLAAFVGWCARTCETGGAAVVADAGASGGQALLLGDGANLLDAAPQLFGAS